MFTALTSRKRRAALPIVAGLSITVLALAGCASDGGTPADGGKFTYLSLTENTTIADTLTALSTGACKAENEAMPLEITNQSQATYDQQLQLLAGQGALPNIFPIGNAPSLGQDLNKGGQLLNIGDALTELDEPDAILPSAAGAIESLYGDSVAIPTELNVEGIWYNKQILADNNITAPTTWDELVASADTLRAAGIQPFSASGGEGWPLTRLVGNYLFRTVGPDALDKVADGSAKLTDPEYVEAAAAVADLGVAGDFGQGVGSIDYDTAVNTFTSGGAAYFYMGSWVLGAFNDDATNQIGADNIGFIPFPEVEGGSGSSSDLASNVGLPLAMSKAGYNDGAKAWLKCIAENFGTESLANQGVLTGLQVTGDVDVPALTAQVQEQIAAAESGVLWFEAKFPAEATTTSQTNAAQLVTGAITPEEFMTLVQADLD